MRYQMKFPTAVGAQEVRAWGGPATASEGDVCETVGASVRGRTISDYHPPERSATSPLLRPKAEHRSPMAESRHPNCNFRAVVKNKLHDIPRRGRCVPPPASSLPMTIGRRRTCLLPHTRLLLPMREPDRGLSNPR